MKRFPTNAMTYPRGLRVWSVLTAGVAFATVFVGTLVTTFRVGMADAVWPTAPWHLLLIDWQEPSTGFLIEHTHRIVGYLIGTCILVQTLALWWLSPSQLRRWSAIGLVVATSVGVGVGMRLVRIAPERSLAALGNAGFVVASLSAILLLAIGFWEIGARSSGRWQRAFATMLILGVIIQGMLGGLRVYLNELRGPQLAVVHGLVA